MSDSPADLPRSEFRVRCAECGHRWVAAYLPMEIRKFVRVTRGQHCPSCGAAPKHVICGWPDDPSPAAKGEA